MTKPSLDTAYALLTRAENHLHDLKIVYNEVLSAYSKATVVKAASDAKIPPGQSMLVAEVESGHDKAPIPDNFRILIGEAANNLRSALNYLVSRLAELDSPGIPKARNLQFPIETSPDRFKGQRPSYLAGVNDAHVAKIEQLQPYDGRDPWLMHLAKLSNFHKHDDLVIVLHDMVVNVTIAPAEENPGELSASMHLQPLFKIALGDGLPIIETLEVLKSQVTQALDAFKPEF